MADIAFFNVEGRDVQVFIQYFTALFRLKMIQNKVD